MKINRKIAIFEYDLYNTLKWYLLLTQHMHKIKNQGVEVLTMILYLYHISEEEDEIDKWAEVFSFNNRIRIREALDDMSEATFNNHLSTLRKIGAIKNNRVVNSFNPVIEKDADMFEMTLRFKIKR